jgi:hypothetical protein
MQRRDFIGTLAGGTIATSLPTRLLAASISDFFSGSIVFRVTPESGHRSVQLACLKCATSGLGHFCRHAANSTLLHR